MIQCVAFAVLLNGLPQVVLTAEEIRARLELPVTIRTVPERLPVVLDELGSLVGVRIRAEAELNRAVVVVAVRNKSAKDVLQRLLDGIGAGSIVQNGAVNVGMRVATPEQEIKQKAEFLVNIKSWFQSQAKSLGCDEPMDDVELSKAATFAMAAFNRDPVYGGIQIHPSVYQVAYRTPIRRFIFRLCQVIDPRFFAIDEDRPSYLSLKDLPEDQQQAALRVLALFVKEQTAWAKNFAQVRKRAEATGSYWLPSQITTDAEPLDNISLTGFRMALRPEQRQMTVEVLSGNNPIMEGQEYLLTRRQRYTPPEGKPFDTSQVTDFKVPIDDRIVRFTTMITNYDGKPKLYDAEVMRQFANPWKYDPLSFSRAQPAGLVAEKLGVNLVAYLGDQLIHSVLYSAPVTPELSAREVLNSMRYSSYSAGLRKKDDWLTLPCSDPDSYLKSQMDRAPLDHFLSRVLQVGCLTINEYCKARNDIGRYRFGLATMFAQIVQPGFESLNPYTNMVDIFSELTPAQMTTLANGGLPIASLPPKLANSAKAIAVSYGGYHNPGDPEGLYTDPPTKDDLKKARMTLVFDQPRPGFIWKYYVEGQEEPNYYRWTSYQFTDVMKMIQGVNQVDYILNSIQSPRVRLCHAIPITLRIEVPRKQGAVVSGFEFDANMGQAAVLKEQFRATLVRLLGG